MGALRAQQFRTARARMTELGLAGPESRDEPFLAGYDREIVVMSIPQFVRTMDELYALATSTPILRMREADDAVKAAKTSEEAALGRLVTLEDLLRQANGDIASLGRGLDKARAAIGFEWEPEEGD